MSSDIAIAIAGLSKCYQIYDRPQDRLKQGLWRGRKQFYREFWALRNVSFDVARGETVGIIGRNGSGKSTLLQIIAGTLAATSGSVETHGRTAALLELGSGFNPEFSGRDNVYMNGAIIGLSRAEIDEQFAKIEAFADIGEFIDQPVKSYSSGMLVRLAFAVSAHVNPDVLIVDEALAVGDMAFQFKCLDRLAHLKSTGMTLLFVSHDLGMVKTFCERAVYLSSGEIRAMGTPDEVAESYLLDLRDSQVRTASSLGRVTAKPSVGGAKGIAFGTGQGKIVEARFRNTAGQSSAYTAGEAVEIEVTAEFDRSVQAPSLSILIQDRRLIPIAGKICPLPEGEIEGESTRRLSVAYSFPALLAQGIYFVTLRLENRLTRSTLMPIDKQVGALSFEVIRPQTDDFLGLVELPIHCQQLLPQ
jgi:lipopolysaccharide transport system ATP-binding protein